MKHARLHLKQENDTIFQISVHVYTHIPLNLRKMKDTNPKLGTKSKYTD